jgi:nucleotide-binding universal stress UspA family protein
MTYQRILCPIDFSDGSRAAMHVACRLALELEVALELAHVFHLPPLTVAGEYPIVPESIDLLVGDAEKLLADAAHEAVARKIPKVSTAFLRGVPWNEIVATASADAAHTLIVMGTHGRTGVSRLLVGSVAEKVVRHAGCDVLVVRPDGSERSFAHALCPIDFSEPSKAAAARAAQLVAPRGTITLLHVVEIPSAYSNRARLEPPAAQVERAAQLLDAFAAELRATTTARVITSVRVGDPGAMILAAIDADPTIELAATGSHGRTGIRRVLLGSVAEKIVRYSPRASLVVHASGR